MKPRRRDGGMSLLEIVIAMAIVAVALLAMLSLISSSNRVQDDSRERTLAYNAARRVIEQMRATSHGEIYRRFNGTTSDDIATTDPGNTFEVDDLPRGPGGAAQGTIIFPENSPGGGIEENPSDVDLALELGLPKDINRDGDTNDTVLTGYEILPVKVLVQWQVPGGKLNKITVVTYMAER